MSLTKKSKDFLKKIKYQTGGVQPIPSGYDLQKPVVSQASVPPVQSLPQVNTNYTNWEIPQTQQEDSWESALSSVGTYIPAIQMAMATKTMMDAKKAQKDYLRKKKWYKQDLQERQNDIRANEYVNSPYGSTFQVGGNMEAFSFGYEQQKAYNQASQEAWDAYYQQLNQVNRQKYKDLENKSYNQAASAVTNQLNLASSLLQEGGEYDPKKDIYSQEFDKNVFLETPEQTQGDISEEVQKRNEKEELMAWIFEDDNSYSPIQEEYETYSPSTNDTIEGIGYSESRGKYDVVNPTTGTTGKYQFHPKYWADKISQFSGFYGSQAEVMNHFKSNPQLQDQFMNHVVETIYKPEIKKLQPYIKKYGFTENQMIRFLHYRGLADTKKRLMTGDFEISAEERKTYGNPSILNYISR
jgi:hypothetical protein